MFIKSKRILTLFVVSMTLLTCAGLTLAGKGGKKPPKDDGGGGGGPLAKPAFVYRDISNRSLFLTILDGSATQRLTKTKGKQSDKAPVWSPDGSIVAFLRHPDHTKVWTDLYTINADGSSLTKIRSFDNGPIPGDGQNRDTLTWSPDGSRIVYAGVDPTSGFHSLWAVTVASGALEPVLIDPQFGGVADPAFSPDLNAAAAGYQGFLAFTGSTLLGNNDLWMLEVTIVAGLLQTGELIQLTNTPTVFHEQTPAFAPDGAYIAYKLVYDDPETLEFVSEVRVRNLGTGEDWFVADVQTSKTELTWSPDALEIAFDDIGDSWDLYRVSPWDPDLIVVPVTNTAVAHETEVKWNPNWSSP